MKFVVNIMNACFVPNITRFQKVLWTESFARKINSIILDFAVVTKEKKGHNNSYQKIVDENNPSKNSNIDNSSKH